MMVRLGQILIVALLSASAALAEPVAQGPKNVPELVPEWPTQTRADAMRSGVNLQVEVLARGLDHPWGMAVLPDGRYLVTERSGALLIVKGRSLSAPIRGLPKVDSRQQGGLLDVALDLDFAQNRVIYLTYAKPIWPRKTATAAARARLSEDGTRLLDLTEIFVQTPASLNPMHFGSRIVPTRDHVFITTGEHFSQSERQLAQDINTTYGKVVRLNLDGSVPYDNPFAAQGGAAAQVWSMGHRNPQGAARHPDTGMLWLLEHGPKGGDELNQIRKGANYGWPLLSYGENYNGSSVGQGITVRDGFASPRYYWDPVIAPGGFAFYAGALFADWQGDVLAASLNPGGLVRLQLDGNKVVGEERFLEGDMRIRDVEIDRDGAILLLDDSNGRVLRVTPK